MKKIALSERLSKDVSLITHRPVSEEAFKRATQIVDDVRSSGDKAVISYGELFNELRNGQVVFSKAECEEVCKRINVDTLGLFTRCCERVRQFAAAQRGSIREVEIDIQGGSVGHRIIPVNRAGCYVPGGRYPLVSSLIMSVVTARAAGVKDVWVATPRPSDEMLAASFIAGADGVIGVGGAHAIAALAYGFKDLKGCDCIVGPGNSFVTAAKHIVSSVVKIDMLAGPSELLVIADDTASPSLVAADLLAQAEHDTEAVPILISKLGVSPRQE
jgi:phosphoribosyl-ATP pyrophosphohydrolase/phosphoribosyl-AMP cyclohydrolase/histidinol dehydrogenase